MILDQRRIHIVGIGGAGMSALAKLLAAAGHQVSGSDLRGGAGLAALADLGVETVAGHVPQLAVAADLVVASSAVPPYDEELTAAEAAGLPVWQRPRLLDVITSRIPTIGATGTHGKTTTTALLVTALRAMGHDPSYVVGGDLVETGSNGHLGSDDLLVLEADEAFRTFESLHLRGLVVTNVEVDHLDHFGDVAGLQASFTRVAGAVVGPVLCCADNRGSMEVARSTGASTYGLSADATWHVGDLVTGREGSSFTLTGPSRSVAVTVARPGAHIAVNAAGAIALLAELGHDLERLARSVVGFRGVGRRWEHRGTVGGVTLYDDYAHHPTEVAATLQAARTAGSHRLWAVFQPHLYSRTERFSDEFGEALANADVVVVTDVYGAREEPVPGVTGEIVAAAARSHGAEVHYVAHRADLAGFLAPLLEPGDLVVSMGAGDITLLHNELAVLLARVAS